MNPLLTFHHRTPAGSDGFYHANCPQLFAQHDTITTLADCPFPLVTDSFRVIHFGTSISQPDDTAKGYGHAKRFAVVEYVKTCGHLARERIPFIEDVKGFDHYGTKFTGAGYSISDWEARIEYFRNTPCEVCGMIKHALWIWSLGEGPQSRAKAVSQCLFLLDANYTNWRELTPESEIRERFAAIKKRSAA